MATRYLESTVLKRRADGSVVLSSILRDGETIVTSSSHPVDSVEAPDAPPAAGVIIGGRPGLYPVPTWKLDSSATNRSQPYIDEYSPDNYGDLEFGPEHYFSPSWVYTGPDGIFNLQVDLYTWDPNVLSDDLGKSTSFNLFINDDQTYNLFTPPLAPPSPVVVTQAHVDSGRLGVAWERTSVLVRSGSFMVVGASNDELLDPHFDLRLDIYMTPMVTA